MIFFVADLFIEQYAGGAELTTEALIQGGYFPCNKVISSNPNLLNLMQKNNSAFWIFGNFDNMPESCLLYAAKNLDYSVLEYDYKYCKYRSPGKHVATEGECNCKSERKGKVVSIFLNKAKTTWWMSKKQLEHYQSLFPFLKNDNNKVLSSVFSAENINYIISLDTSQKDNKYLILNSPSWIKGVEEAVEFAKENNLEYELVWGLKHQELLAKLAKSKGIIFFPKAGDTCPRMTIEAKLLNCDLILNANVQHKDEPWFENRETTLDYLRERTESFWNGIEKISCKNLSIPNEIAIENNNKTKFNFIIPFYNCEKWILKCIKSIKRQKYKNFTCVLIDDMSTDQTTAIIEKNIRDDDRFVLIKNKEKKYALANIVDAIEELEQEDNDVVILLDGDDWLASSNTLSILNKNYDHDCQLTYGSYVYHPRGTKGVEPSKYPDAVTNTNSYRRDIWRASHLRTFRRGLWNKLNYDDLKDKSGAYYKMTYDQAIMLPLLELADNKFKYIPEILHVYNKENPLNVDKIKAHEQTKIAKEIRHKKPHMKIARYTGKTENFHIHNDYVSRTEYVACEQTDHTDEFQDEVYADAHQLFLEKGYKTVLDIGCGSAYKLVKYFSGEKVVGLDLEPNLSFIKNKYPDLDFRLSDFNNPPKESYDLVICSDVIEHVLNPNELLNFINKIDFKHLVLSSPEREYIQVLQKSFGWKVITNGPPHNEMHVREWSFGEFANYISDFFNIESQYMTPIQTECQIIIASPRRK